MRVEQQTLAARPRVLDIPRRLSGEDGGAKHARSGSVRITPLSYRLLAAGASPPLQSRASVRCLEDSPKEKAEKLGVEFTLLLREGRSRAVPGRAIRRVSSATKLAKR